MTIELKTHFHLKKTFYKVFRLEIIQKKTLFVGSFATIGGGPLVCKVSLLSPSGTSFCVCLVYVTFLSLNFMQIFWRFLPKQHGEEEVMIIKPLHNKITSENVKYSRIGSVIMRVSDGWLGNVVAYLPQSHVTSGAKATSHWGCSGRHGRLEAARGDVSQVEIFWH